MGLNIFKWFGKKNKVSVSHPMKNIRDDIRMAILFDIVQKNNIKVREAGYVGYGDTVGFMGYGGVGSVTVRKIRVVDFNDLQIKCNNIYIDVLRSIKELGLEESEMDMMMVIDKTINPWWV